MNAVTTHPRKQTLFVLLSVADFALTWWLLAQSGSAVYESNPVAAELLNRFGWLGLATFKAVVVGLVLILATLIAQRRPAAGGRVLTFGCATLAFVVLYSSYLCGAASASGAAVDAGPLETLAQKREWLDEEHRKHNTYREFIGRLVDDLLAGRCTLAEAVERLRDSERARDATWREMLVSLTPERPFDECLAGEVIMRAVALCTNHEDARRVAEYLESDFQNTYASPPPYRHRIFLYPPSPVESDDDSTVADMT